jgi:hypothetical protein
MIARLVFTSIALLSLHAFAAEGEAPKPESTDKPAAAGNAKLKTFSYDCEAWEEGVPPQEVFVVDGTIRVAKKDGNKTLMVDINPIVDASAQLGESANGEETITARFFASKRGRSNPRFGLSVHGNSGYRLMVNCAKKVIELVKDDAIVASAPFAWATETWTVLKLEAKQASPGKWTITGKAWADGSTEPADAMITHPDEKMKGQGKAAVWGTPFSEMPVYIDDIKITAAGK